MRDGEKGPEGDKESVPPFFFHKIYFFKCISSQSNSRRTPTFSGRGRVNYCLCFILVTNALKPLFFFNYCISLYVH